MSKKDFKKIIKDKSKLNTPDLWDKIEGKLVDKDNKIKEIKVIKKKSNMKKYLQIGLAAAILCFVVIVRGTTAGTPIKENTNNKIEEKSKDPVLYSSLNFGEGLQISEENSEDDSQYVCSEADICAFSEDRVVKESNVLCKATVINEYKKEYNYSTYYDKFGEVGKLYQTKKSDIYEVRIDKLYYSEGTVKEGDIIKIENDKFFGTSISSSASLLTLKKDHQYIFPLQKIEGNILYDLNDYAEGDIKGEGQYGICYQFIPQIEITRDKEYIFPGKWESLVDDNTIDVIIDNEKVKSVDEGLLMGGMKLRRDEGFERDFMEMVKKYKSDIK